MENTKIKDMGIERFPRELRIRANLKACVREQTIFVRLREKAA